MISTINAQSVRIKSKVDIDTLINNTIPRNFARYLFIGTGSTSSRLAWEHICAQLKNELKPYNITANNVYLNSDTNVAKVEYAQLVKEHAFDAILWFSCDGKNELVQMRGMNDPGVALSNENITEILMYEPGERKLKYLEGIKKVGADQKWTLTIYTTTPNEVIWRAYMHSVVIETKEYSYQKVTDALMGQFKDNLLLPTSNLQ